jgi:NAD(P)-dependent dehydrogenase (short-subunit alcohol dehydrogenase family)/alkylhydroperoxidase family enzyme
VSADSSSNGRTPAAGGQPRLPPARPAQMGRVNAVIVDVIRRAAGTQRAPNLFTTLARHRRLFRGWLRFAGALMPRGVLPRPDTELVILRVAHNCHCEYEWGHHERLGQAAGLSAAAVERVKEGPEVAGWSARQVLLLRSADALHLSRDISDELWAALTSEFSEVELIELLLLVGHYEMLATTINTLRITPDEPTRSGDARSALAGRRVLITGAARGIGAATARRLHERGAHIALAGIEPDLLAAVAADCGGAPALACDVRDRVQVEAAVAEAVAQLGGLDVVIANAGVAAQLPILGGAPEIFERTIEVNLLGVYYTLRAAAPHIAHPGGYALAISSLAAAVHPPLLGAYSASKAGVEALADALRVELQHTGARVGVAYFAELDTDMTSRGFGTEAASRIRRGPRRVAPLKAGVDAIERGVASRSRRVVAPSWTEPLLHVRMLAQRVVERATAPGLDEVLDVARRENAPLTTALANRESSAGDLPNP